MNGKNLLLKFGFLVVIVATCILSLWLKGLKQGIDLRGGSELVYQIYTNKDRQEHLRKEREALEEQLKTAEGAEQRKELQARIDGMGVDIEALNIGDPSDLAQRMIAVFKRRVDPTGTGNVEWRPMGADRFAVRMPAAREDSQVARELYADALAALEARNLRPSQISQAVAKPAGNKRIEAIVALAGDDKKELAKDLVLLGKARDRMDQAGADADAREKAEDDWDKELERFRSRHKKEIAIDLLLLGKVHDKIKQAQAGGDADAHREVLVRWRARLKEFRAKHNLRSAEMQAVLQRYAAARAVKDKRTQYKLRMEEYEDALAKLRNRFPNRDKKISAVVEQHKGWLKVHQHLDDPADLKRLIAKAGQIEFRIAPALPRMKDEMMPISAQDYSRYRESLRDEGPEGAAKHNWPLRWFPVHGPPDEYQGVVIAEYAGQSYMLLHTQPRNTMLQQRGRRDWSLKRSYPTTDRMNTPAVGFEFDERGAKRFSSLTQEHVKHFMAVLLDDTVYSCPTIREAISDSGIISGSFSREEVIELVRILEAGSLPARLNPVPLSESKFGPALGKVNREMGKMAAYAGIIAVAVFMLIYYVRSGFIADVALLLNIVLVLGVMSMFNVVFTLPGIAGVILTVGIAVDANVLIFERLREEQARGQSVGMAIKNAYDRALSAIFDANVTTLITCLILGWVSTEEVKGFAITLGLGVAFSMFTALVVTRWIFQLLLKVGLLKNPVFMLHIIGVPKINWLAKRKWFWGISGVMIVAGTVAFFGQGKDILGIEFSAGTKAVISLTDGKLLDGELPNDELVRSKFEAAAGKLGFDKLKATARVEEVIDPDRAKNFVTKYDGKNGGEKDGKISLAELPAGAGEPANSRDYFRRLMTAVDEDGNGVLDSDELDNLPALAYWVTTTEATISKVVDAANEAFGDSLKRRLGALKDEDSLELFTGEVISEVGIEASGEGGLTRISAADRSAAAAGLLQDFDGGLMMVVADMAISMSLEDIEDRILQMRFQGDYENQRQNTCRVIPRGGQKDGKYKSFAILVLPAEGGSLDNEAWRLFAADERNLLEAALKRSEAIDSVNFDPSIASDKAQSAIMAIVLSWLAIVGYLWFRFGSPQWGLAAVICLVHDVIIVVGLVAISNTVIGRAFGCAGFKIDLPMIAAILTVIGYSVNDTIVVFDRIRENRGKLSAVSEQVINASINQTLGRTLLTSGTTFIVVLIMFVWGGPGIHAFNYALLAGIIFGTYSSVAIASPLLLGFKQAVLAKTLSAASKG